MKTLSRNFLVLASLGMLATSSAFAWDTAVAILYNPQTGAWAAHTGNSRYEAEVEAMNAGDASLYTDIGSLENRSSNVKETWALNGWVALAKGYSTFGTSSQHYTQYAAEESALANCGGEANGCTIVRSLSSY